MTPAQLSALLDVLDYLWAYGCDRHPAPARELNRLREALGLPQKEYRS